MASADSKFDDFCLQCIQFDALIARELSEFTCTRSLTMNEKFPHSADSCGVEISRQFVVSELEQLNPDNSLAECVHL